MNFDTLKEIIDNGCREKDIPCADIIVSYKNEIVYRYMTGTRDDEKKLPLKGDEMYFLYSASKPMTCTAALQLYEKGLIALDDYVYKYIPEFKDMKVKTPDGLVDAKGHITIKNLFTMSSGLDYNLESDSIKAVLSKNPDAPTLDIVRAIANEPLQFHPGEHYLYSLSHDVLAAVVEVVSGMKFEDYVKKNIYDVCGMKHTTMTVTDDVLDRMCSQYVYDAQTNTSSLMPKKNQYILSSSYHSGGAGMISCVDDYIKFAQAMANGETLLKKETIALMSQNQLTPEQFKDFSPHKPGYTYGLGVRTNVSSDFSEKGEFGWDGAAGSYTIIDPKNNIAVFYGTHVRNHGNFLYFKHHMDIRDEIYKVLLNR